MATRLGVDVGGTFTELILYGDPAQRDPELVQRDLREGRITPEHARETYPHAVC